MDQVVSMLQELLRRSDDMKSDIQSLKKDIEVLREETQKEIQSIRDENQTIREEIQSIREEIQMSREENRTMFNALREGNELLKAKQHDLSNQVKNICADMDRVRDEDIYIHNRLDYQLGKIAKHDEQLELMRAHRM